MCSSLCQQAFQTELQLAFKIIEEKNRLAETGSHNTTVSLSTHNKLEFLLHKEINFLCSLENSSQD